MNSKVISHDISYSIFQIWLGWPTIQKFVSKGSYGMGPSRKVLDNVMALEHYST